MPLFRVTARPFEQYCETFDITPTALKPNAKILDVGSGLHQEFARGMAAVRSDIRAISVDPTLEKLDLAYEIEDNYGNVRPVSEAEHKERMQNIFGEVIGAIAPNLSFANNESFDYIFDYHGPFMYFSEERLLERYVKELVRIAKAYGFIFIFPLDSYKEAALSDVDRLRKSKARMSRILRKLKITKYSIFTHKEQVGDTNSFWSRLGIKIIK